VLEYPVLIRLAILCRPGLEMPTDTRTRLLWLARSRPLPSWRFPGLTGALCDDEKAFNWTIGAMLVIAGQMVSREPLPFAAVNRGRIHHRTGCIAPKAKCARPMRSFSACHQRSRPLRRPVSACSLARDHDPRRPNGCGDDEGRGGHRQTREMITYYHVNSPMWGHRQGNAPSASAGRFVSR